MRSYEKTNPEKPVLTPSPVKIKKVEEASTVSIKNAGESYKKEEGKRLPYSFLVIVSGGEVRERNYFKIISDQKRFKQVKIEFVADPQQLNPDGLLNTAKYKQAHYKTSQEEEPDKIFIVSDVDHFIAELLRIKPECERLDISLVISNPCFEVWLYYGKFTAKPTDFVMPSDSLKISSSFKTYLNKKIRGGVNPIRAIFDISESSKNAKANYKEEEHGIPELFSTNMFILAEALLPLVDAELKELTAENENERKKNVKKTIHENA